MPTTFQKRQKEMKRLEKARMKVERRAQKKLAKRAESENPSENIAAGEVATENESAAAGPELQS
jgi:hypothetical protein